MVNETILNYLRSYKDNFPIEKLKSEILSKGYSEGEFNEALEEINKKRPISEPVKSIQNPIKTMDLEKEIQEVKDIPAQETFTQTTERKTIQSSPQTTNEQPQFKKIPDPHTNKKKTKMPKEKKMKNPNKKKSKAWVWILLILVLAAIGVVITNYFGTSIFGFNVFNL